MYVCAPIRDDNGEIVAESNGHAEGLADAGHWLMETHADTVNARLLDWFGRPEDTTG